MILPVMSERDVDLGLRPHLAARRDRGDEIAPLHLLGAHLDRLVAALGGGQSADRDRDDGDDPADRAIFDLLAHVSALGGP